MPQRENPLDDETFRDLPSTARADEETLLAADSFTEGGDQPDAELPLIGRNGHHHLSGPLGLARLASPAQEDSPRSQRRRNKLLPLILGVVGLVVIVSCLGLGAVITINLLSLQSSLNSPQTTLDDFYSALHTGDYQTAYNQLSSGYQQKKNLATFQVEFSLHGPIQSYEISDLQTQGQQANATVKLVLGLQGEASMNQTQAVQLIVENNAWKIDAINAGPLSSP